MLPFNISANTSKVPPPLKIALAKTPIPSTTFTIIVTNPANNPMIMPINCPSGLSVSRRLAVDLAKFMKFCLNPIPLTPSPIATLNSEI